MVLATVTASAALTSCGGGSSPDATIDSYLRAWDHADYAAMARLVDHPPSDFIAFNREVANGLDLVHGSHERRSVTTTGSTATASVSSHLALPFGSITERSTLRLSDGSGTWRVQWTPESILSVLKRGDTVATQVTWPPRAAIAGLGGAPLTTETPMVSIGIEGSRVTNPAALTSALQQAGAPMAQIQSAESTALAHPTWFVPVLSVTQSAYSLLKPIVYPVGGTVFQTFSSRTALTPELGAHVVGSLGPITAQQLHSLGPAYSASDLVGQSGIEQAYQKQLVGTPSAVVTVSNHAGHTVRTLARFAATAGTPVTTTIDPAVQQAAETALGGVTLPASIVALQASTGSVLASVSTPDTTALNNALVGAYPPGSTFKVITSSDLIEHGSSPSSPTTCPPTITVNGEVFHNFEGEASGALTMEQAFAMSCNTAFIGLANTLPAATFPSTASQFGIGATLHLGLAAFGGRVPAPTSPSESAATAIGQAQVVVSPLDLANVAASVDSGSLHLPRLIVGAADDTAPAQPIDQGVINDLRTMMDAVVTSSIGTAAGAHLPSGTFGKTGTAEFGTATPPQTDAWFIGYRGDLAFAVLVVGGGVGGQVAAPIATKFLTAVGAAPL
jgi:hypothetical protein